MTEVVSLLLNAGAKPDLEDEVLKLVGGLLC